MLSKRLIKRDNSSGYTHIANLPGQVIAVNK